MTPLEKFEWTNTWWESLDNPDLPRILLVGDSIINGTKGPFRSLIKEDIAVDAFMTSKALDNPNFCKELFAMIDDTQYKTIVFNNGLHGFHLNGEEYGRFLDETIAKLMAKCPNSEIIISASTPISEKDDNYTFSKDKNPIVLERNIEAKAVAEKYKLRYKDTYAAVAGKGELRANDCYHYTPEGYMVLAEDMYKFLGLN